MMISCSHWGLFPCPREIYVIPDLDNIDLRPGALNYVTPLAISRLVLL